MQSQPIRHIIAFLALTPRLGMLRDSTEITSNFWLNISNSYAILDKRQKFSVTSYRVT